ncbi:DNRLRE domain-containing protein [Thermaerobacillus caldiproteolyticus]|uniref:DNRLRE domain-containing protein n=1 Tax=Thermaerobacillus caldiproteolyticus TaxID=247480 RepID=UPI00188D5EB0|nr:DNRLRE domain-containing protein [Anoxybacillus caldiproteolyticus]QPA31630.1 fibronectin type III domain-containing protein [Anoxybacillus caldiproteolyticus]
MPTQNFKVGEMLNKRTPFSKTWINFDGSYTTEIYNAPVHYEDENGNLHNINTDLYDEADLDHVDFPVAKEGIEEFRMMKSACINLKKKNILDRDSLDFQGLKVPFDCRIPKNFKRGYVIGKGQNRLRFIPVGASPSKGYIEKDKKNCVHYQDVWNDTDVCLEVMPNGVKETIILKSDRAPFSFSFEVDGPLADDLTAGEMRLHSAWLVDANGTKRDVSQTIRRENGKTYVDLVADVTGLVYPIGIDPTVTIDSTIKDVLVSPTGTNSTSQNYTLGTVNNNPNRILYHFDVSSIPAGAIILSAYLNLYSYGSNGSFLAYINAILENWNTYVSWNNLPKTTYTQSGQPDHSLNVGININQYDAFEITKIVQKWVNGQTNYGVMIQQFDEGTNTNKSYRSPRASDNRPYVSINYNVPPTAPTVTSPNGGETWNAQHTITWNAATDGDNEQIIDTGQTKLREGTIGQLFTAQGSVINKLKFNLSVTSSGSVSFGVGIYSADVNGLPTNQLFYTNASTTLDTNPREIQIAIYPNLNVTPGQKYVVVLFLNGITYGHGSTGKTDGGFVYRNGSAYVKDPSKTLYLIVGYVSMLLSYQIQLSINNGQTWKDIVPLTSLGATSYTYDFSNEPETSLAKIRIRAYDGTSYGSWDESDGVFTIQHNQAPTVPTNLSPSGGASVDRASVVRLSWQHNDPNSNDPQSQFDLQWRKQGDATWNDVSQVTTNQYWDAPEGTFPKGTIEWRVRTYDQAGLSSPYSDIQTFFAGDKPANPTITNITDGSIVPVANPVIQWSSVGQTGYHVKLLDSNDDLLWEIQANSANKAQTILYGLQNNTDYKIQLAIKNADNLWSDFVTVNIHVSYTPPAVPIVTTTKGEGIITISIDNPIPSGTQPNVSYNDLYRRKQGESTWTRIAKNIPADASFVDYTPASGQVYQYLVRAWGDNGTYSDSPVVSESISFIGVWLHEAANPLETLHQFKLVSDRSGNWQPTATMMQFAGRRLPVAEYDDTEQHSVSVKFSLLKDSGDLEALEKLIRSKNTLCYRDARGRKMFCHVFQLPVDDEVYGNTVSLTFEEVSYTEEV